MENVVNLLGLIAILLVFVILILLGVYAYIVYAAKRKKEEKEKAKKEISEEEKNKKFTSTGLPKESIYSFMDFDDVRDNMIVRKDGSQYVMVIACQGINFDLMSEAEKMSVEEGFVQFLNTLKFPIQLYMQTRTLNLRDIVDTYRKKVNTIQDDLDRLEIAIKEAERRGNQEEIDNLNFERRRKQNIAEYGSDITEYVARLSQNHNVLQQKMYVVVPYYTMESGNLSNYSKDEIDNICFAELYTRCQAVIRSLGTSEVTGRVLESEELAELLYVAYDREDAEVLTLRKALDAQYDALYSTGKDVLEKRKEAMDEEINAKAVELATKSIIEANKEILRKQQQETTVEQRAMEIIEQYKDQMSDDLYEETKDQLNKSKKSSKSSKKVEEKAEEKQEEKPEEIDEQFKDILEEVKPIEEAEEKPKKRTIGRPHKKITEE